MIAYVHIRLKSDVLDPQGQAIAQVLKELGFNGVTSVRQGKMIQLTLDETNASIAYDLVCAMCEQLLVNPVIETYDITLDTNEINT